MTASRFVPFAAIGVALPVASITRLFATVSTLKKAELIVPSDLNDTFKLKNGEFIRLEIFATVSGDKKSVDHPIGSHDIENGDSEIFSVEENLKSLFNALELEKPERREIRTAIERYHTFARKKHKFMTWTPAPAEPVVQGDGSTIQAQVITEERPEWTEKNERNQEKRINIINTLAGESEATLIDKEDWTPEIIEEVDKFLKSTIEKLGL